MSAVASGTPGPKPTFSRGILPDSNHWIAYLLAELRLRGRGRYVPTESDVGRLLDFPYSIDRNSSERRCVGLGIDPFS
jgi:hypothetical protein